MKITQIDKGYKKGKQEALKECGKAINEAVINRYKLDIEDETKFLESILSDLNLKGLIGTQILRDDIENRIKEMKQKIKEKKNEKQRNRRIRKQAI